MAEEKRYYWLRLYDDFFGSFRIKKLRRMAGGDTYVIIYLKMQLKAMKTDGVLQYRGLGTDFVEELSIDLDEEPDDVRVTLMYLLSCGLAETNDQKTFFFPYSVANTGSETSSAQRMREARAKVKELPGEQCANNVRTMCEHRYVEKEIDTRDIEIDRDREEKKNNNPIYLSGSENAENDPGAELRRKVEESMERIKQRREACH